MKVLVVGARGFIGSALVRELLARGTDVSCVTRGSLLATADSKAEWFRVDHLSQQSWNEIISERFDVIYHLGWSTIPRTAESDPVSDLADNVGSALRLLISVRKLSPKSRLIFSSSGGTVYGRADAPFVDETHAPKPISAYGLGKVIFEHYLMMYRQEHSIESVRARISNAYGPEQNTNRSFGAVSTFLRMAMEGETIKIFGSEDITRDYIYISDLCNALYKLGTVENPPECVNIGSGQGSSLLNIIEILQLLIGRKVDFEVIESRNFDLRRLVLDISRIRSMLQWEPQVSLHSGIKMMLDLHPLFHTQRPYGTVRSLRAL